MRMKKSLLDAMNTYGQMLRECNYPGNVFLFRG